VKNAFSTKKEFGKVVIVGQSYNAKLHAGPEADGGSGADPPSLRRFLPFFFQKYALLSILWSKFLLKRRLI